jgi:hypothetical protein
LYNLGKQFIHPQKGQQKHAWLATDRERENLLSRAKEENKKRYRFTFICGLLSLDYRLLPSAKHTTFKLWQGAVDPSIYMAMVIRYLYREESVHK